MLFRRAKKAGRNFDIFVFSRSGVNDVHVMGLYVCLCTAVFSRKYATHTRGVSVARWWEHCFATIKIEVTVGTRCSAVTLDETMTYVIWR
jgi:hypothetical protein